MPASDYNRLLDLAKKGLSSAKAEDSKINAKPFSQLSTSEMYVQQTPDNNSFLRTTEGRFLYNVVEGTDPNFAVLSTSSVIRSVDGRNLSAYRKSVEAGRSLGGSQNQSRDQILKEYYGNLIQNYGTLIGTIEQFIKTPPKTPDEGRKNDIVIREKQANVNAANDKISQTKLNFAGQFQSNAATALQQYAPTIKSMYTTLKKMYDELKGNVKPPATSLNELVSNSKDSIIPVPGTTGGFTTTKPKPAPQAPKPDPQIQARTNPPRPAPPPRPGRR